MKLTLNKDTGRIYARLKTGDPAKPYIKMTLGTKSAEEARKKAKAANLQQIEAALQAGQLSTQAISRLTAGKKVTVEEAAERWFAAARNRDEAASTTLKSESTLRQWFAHSAVAKLPPMALNEGHVSAFVNREDDNVGAATRERQLSVIRTFLNYCADAGLTHGNVAGKTRMAVQHRNLTHAQMEPKKVEPFTAAEVKKIMANTEGWWRWATGISAAAGLRLGDVATLEHASLSVPGHIIVHTGKRNKRVCLPVTDRLTPGLADILSEIPPGDSPYLFPEQAAQYDDITSGRPKFSVYFGRILERLGIEGRTFHSLRHLAISRWKREGFSLDECKVFAGHSNSKTTQGYIKSL